MQTWHYSRQLGVALGRAVSSEQVRVVNYKATFEVHVESILHPSTPTMRDAVSEIWMMSLYRAVTTEKMLCL